MHYASASDGFRGLRVTVTPVRSDRVWRCVVMRCAALRFMLLPRAALCCVVVHARLERGRVPGGKNPDPCANLFLSKRFKEALPA